MPEPLKPDELNELTRISGAAGARPDPSEAGATPPGETPPPPGDIRQISLESFEPTPLGPRDAGIGILSDVDVNVRVELGRSRVLVRDILKLTSGSVIPLESLTGDPLDVYVNDRLIARGEILVVNDNFALRITEVLPQPKAPDK